MSLYWVKRVLDGYTEKRFVAPDGEWEFLLSFHWGHNTVHIIVDKVEETNSEDDIPYDYVSWFNISYEVTCNVWDAIVFNAGSSERETFLCWVEQANGKQARTASEQFL